MSNPPAVHKRSSCVGHVAPWKARAALAGLLQNLDTTRVLCVLCRCRGIITTPWRRPPMPTSWASGGTAARPAAGRSTSCRLSATAAGARTAWTTARTPRTRARLPAQPRPRSLCARCAPRACGLRRDRTPTTRLRSTSAHRAVTQGTMPG